VFTGSYDSNTNHLRQFTSQDTSPMKAIDIINLVKNCNWFQSPFLAYDNFDESKFFINYNPKSHPGHYTSKLFHSNEKGFTIPFSFELARKKMDLIKLIPFRNYTLWTLNAREKDMKTFNIDKDKELSTRVVLNTEHYQIILLSYFFQLLMKSIDSFSTSKKFNISGEYNGTKAYKLFKTSQNYDYVVDADWSAFDSSIDHEFLKAAGAIMFSNTIMNDKSSLRMIFHVISSFVTKYFLIPPGLVIDVNRGNPSGHPGVTAINCFVNLIRWAMIGNAIYGNEYYKYMDIEVYGDDSLVFFKDHPNLSKLDSIISNFGFKSDKIADKLYPTQILSIFDNEGPDFLKRRITQCTLTWNYKKMFDKLLYQSKKRSLYDQVELLINYYYTAPGSTEFENFIINFLEYFDGILDEDKDHILKLHIRNSIERVRQFNKNNFILNTNSERIFLNEFKVMNHETTKCITRLKGKNSIKFFTPQEIEIMKVIFFINEYTQHNYKISKIPLNGLRIKLYKILNNFKNIKASYSAINIFNTS